MAEPHQHLHDKETYRAARKALTEYNKARKAGQTGQAPTAAQRRIMSHAEGSHHFLDDLYPKLEAALEANGRANEHKLLRHMRTVLDRESRKLDVPHAGERIFFGNTAANNDRDIVHELCNVTVDEIKGELKFIKFVQTDWHVANNTFNWLMVMVIRYFTAQKNVDHQKLASMFLTLHLYAYIQVLFFPFYNPNTGAAATNSMTDKFILKREGTMFKTLYAITWKSHLKYAPEIAPPNGSDMQLKDYFINTRTRVYGMVKGLKAHYEKTKEQKKFLNMSRETWDDGTPVERDTDSGRIQGLAETAMHAFVGETTNERVLALVVQMTQVPRANLVMAINRTREGDAQTIREVFSDVLSLFFEESRTASPRDVRTVAFSRFCAAIYARSNTKDGRVERIKATLDKILAENSEAYTRTNREATRGALRKAMYLYLVLFLQAKAG